MSRVSQPGDNGRGMNSLKAQVNGKSWGKGRSFNGSLRPSVSKVSAVGGGGGTGLAYWELGVLWFDFST